MALRRSDACVRAARVCRFQQGTHYTHQPRSAAYAIHPSNKKTSAGVPPANTTCSRSYRCAKSEQVSVGVHAFRQAIANCHHQCEIAVVMNVGNAITDDTDLGRLGKTTEN